MFITLYLIVLHW